MELSISKGKVKGLIKTVARVVVERGGKGKIPV
jgi:hypothetical protein